MSRSKLSELIWIVWVEGVIFKRNTYFQIIPSNNTLLVPYKQLNLLKHHLLTLIPKISSLGNCLAPCRHLVSHPSSKMWHGGCLQTATVSITFLKLTAPSIGPESPHGKEQRQQQHLCILKGQRGLGRLGGKKTRCPLDLKPMQYFLDIGFWAETTGHASSIDGQFQDVSIKYIRALNWQHHLNIPELTWNKADETLTGPHLQYK